MQNCAQDGELFYEKEDRAHSDVITDLQMAPDGTYLITSSKDKSAKVCEREGSCRRRLLIGCCQIWSVGPDKNSSGDEDYLTLIKTFTGEPPLNSAAILPGKPYVRAKIALESRMRLTRRHSPAHRSSAEVDKKLWLSRLPAHDTVTLRFASGTASLKRKLHASRVVSGRATRECLMSYPCLARADLSPSP